MILINMHAYMFVLYFSWCVFQPCSAVLFIICSHGFLFVFIFFKSDPWIFLCEHRTFIFIPIWNGSKNEFEEDQITSQITHWENNYGKGEDMKLINLWNNQKMFHINTSDNNYEKSFFKILYHQLNFKYSSDI